MRKSLSLGFKNKRANSILDTALFGVFVVIVGIVGFFAYYLLNTLNTELIADGDLNPVAQTELNELESNMPSLMDGIFILVLVGIWILVIALSYYVETSPLLYGFVFIVGVVMIFVGIAFAEWVTDIQSDIEFVAISSNMPLTFAVLTNFPIYVAIIFFSALITLFAKEGAA